MWLRTAKLESLMFGHPLAREIAVIVAVKTAIIVVAGLLVFGPHWLELNSSAVEAHMFYSHAETNP